MVKKGETNMKKILFVVSCLVATLFLTACSSDIEEQSTSKSNSFEELIFDVSVNGDIPTRSYDNKTGWATGDIIYVSIDGNNDNVCKLTYTEDGKWVVGQQTENVSFANEKGTLTAIYAEKSTYATDGIETSGDILYTTEGEYTKYGYTAYIRLNMNQRPQSKITINGVESGYTLTGKYVSKVASLKDMTFSQENSISPYDLTNQTATFFGTIEPNEDNTTTVRLTNPDTNIVYYRTYSKTMAAGDAIVINGPLSNEASEWTRIVEVSSISLNMSETKLIIGEEMDITAVLLPDNATNKTINWSSSDENVVSITPKETTCHIKALTKGEAIVTAKSWDSSVVAQCKITVDLVNDFLSYGTESFGTSWGNYLFVKWKIRIYNEAPKNIKINYCYVKQNDNGFISHIVGTVNFYDFNPTIESGSSTVIGTYFDIDAKGWGSYGGSHDGSFVLGINYTYDGATFEKDFDFNYVFSYN